MDELPLIECPRCASLVPGESAGCQCIATNPQLAYWDEAFSGNRPRLIERIGDAIESLLPLVAVVVGVLVVLAVVGR